MTVKYCVPQKRIFFDTTQRVALNCPLCQVFIIGSALFRCGNNATSQLFSPSSIISVSSVHSSNSTPPRFSSPKTERWGDESNERKYTFGCTKVKKSERRGDNDGKRIPPQPFITFWAHT